MKNCSPVCWKILWGVRILAGLWILWWWLMKLWASPEMMQMVGSAWPAMWLTFFGVTTWFWIAVVGEILAWLFLVSGCRKLTGIGAGLTIVIMLFALNLMGWTTPDTLLAWIFLAIGIGIFIMGRGARCFCVGPCCKKWSSDKSTTGCCGGWTCGGDKKASGIDQVKEWVATVGAWAVATAEWFVEQAKDTFEDAVDVIEEVTDAASEKMIEATGTLLDKGDELIDDAREVVEKLADRGDKKA